ncbi:unnamed protein product, partial [Mesorhabditis spiculigera]
MKKGSERDKKPKTSTSSSKGKKKKTLEEGGQKKAKGVELVKEKEPAMDPTQEDHTRVDPDLITAVDFEFEQSYKKMQESFPEDSRRLRDRKKRLRPQNTQTNSVTLEDLLGEKQKKKKREQDGENKKPKSKEDLAIPTEHRILTSSPPLPKGAVEQPDPRQSQQQLMYASYVGASGAQIRTWSFTDSRPIIGTALPEYGDPFQQLIIGCFRDECPMRAGVAPPCPTTATSMSSSGQSITIQPSCQTPSSAPIVAPTSRSVRELDVIDTEYAGEDAAKKVPIVEKPLGFEAISRQMRDLTLQIDSVAAEVTSLTKCAHLMEESEELVEKWYYKNQEKEENRVDCAECYGGCNGCTGPLATECTECRVGFERDSKNACVDVDECAKPELHACTKANEVCINDIGSYKCDCADGYKKNDVTKECELNILVATEPPPEPVEDGNDEL